MSGPQRFGSDKPTVSAIVPMLNEAEHIGACLAGFVAQTYPELIEIMVIDGGSTDGSLEIVEEWALRDPRIRLLNNSRRIAAAAANIGLHQSIGEVLCYLSAHGVPDSRYVEVAVEVLVRTGAAGVGGRYLHEGFDPVGNAIGAAMASPFGMASPHRSATSECVVDTISHPVFVKQALLDAGGYDESLLRNEDYETNQRVRAIGGSLVFTPEISSVYRPRRTLRLLGRQFFDYGRWKSEVMVRRPADVRPRHLAAPAAVALGFTVSVSLVPVSTRRIGTGILLALAGLYSAGLVAALVHEGGERRRGMSIRHFLMAMPVMHIAWGSGVWAGLRDALRRRR